MEEEKNAQLQMARERKMKMMQTRDKAGAIALEEAKQKDKQNVLSVHKRRAVDKAMEQRQRQADGDDEKRLAVKKIKSEVIYKKTIAQTSRVQVSARYVLYRKEAIPLV